MQDALQTLVDNGLRICRLPLICKDIVAYEDSERWAVLLTYLVDNGVDVSPDDIEELSYNDNAYSVNGADYLVLSDEEANTACGEYIEDSLWAFNASYLSGKTRLPEEVFVALADQCESANDTIRTIIKGSCGIDDFVNSAIRDDGRGPFLASYDSEELEVCIDHEYYYIYRTN